MNDAQMKAFDKVLEALSFYANANIYLGNLIPLEENLDRHTLSIKHAADHASQVMLDRGELAREALFEFDGVFDVTYEFRTEIYAKRMHNYAKTIKLVKFTERVQNARKLYNIMTYKVKRNK